MVKLRPVEAVSRVQFPLATPKGILSIDLFKISFVFVAFDKNS